MRCLLRKSAHELFLFCACVLILSAEAGHARASSPVELGLKVSENLRLLQWQRIELELSIPLPIAAPFDATRTDAAVWVYAPSGRTFRAPAFYEPEAPGRWLLRVTPDQPGLWRFAPELRLREAGANRLYRGKALALRVPAVAGSVTAGAPGFVRIHPRNPRMLATSDGRPFFAIGANIAWHTHDALAEFERRFDALAANGGNTARVFLAPWSFAPEWRETPLGDYRNRLDRVRQFDRILEMAETRSIRLIVVLLTFDMFTPSGVWAENPYNSANGGPCAAPDEFLTSAAARAAYRNQLRYIAARWGASPAVLAWEWFNEVNSAPGFETARLLPWLEEMSGVLRTTDSGRHLRTISYAAVDGDPRVWASPLIDVVQRHEYSQGDPVWFAPMTDAAGAPRRFIQVREVTDKPVLLTEFGANATSETPVGAYREGIHLHNSLWASAFAGFAGGAMYWWWDAYLEAGDLWHRYRGLSAFLKAEDLALLAPGGAQARASNAAPVTALTLVGKDKDRALIWVRNMLYSHDAALTRSILADSAGEAFVFAPRPARDVTVTVRGLAPGTYVLSGYDTHSGAVVRTERLRVLCCNQDAVFAIPTLMWDAAFMLERQ
jgi:hypothetical protein